VDRFAAMDVFVRVLETGSFSAAARQLGIGQPAVSRAVSALEEHLGVRLLLRSTHGLAPTEAGRQFHAHARAALDKAEEAELAARGAGAALTGRLRVSAPVSLARLHVVPHLQSFLAEHPALELDVVMDDRPIDLVEDGIEVALRMGALSDSTMTARRIGQSRRLVLATPDYLARRGEPASPAELLEHQAVVLLQPGVGTHWTLRKGSAEVALTMRGRARFTSAEGVRAAVCAGLGYTIASEWMFAPELASGAVRALLTEWALPTIDLWAVFPPGRRASAKARAFAAFVEARLAWSQAG
jgi:DNA-binding transcriptional LysR family regulator